jgi:hypothetical protein
MGPRESQDAARADLEARHNPQPLKTSGSSFNGRNAPATSTSLVRGIAMPRAPNSQGWPIAKSVGRSLGDFDLDK